MGVNYKSKFAIGIMTATLLSVPNLAQAQAQSKLIIEDFVGTINWTQSNDDIKIDVIRGASEIDVKTKGDSEIQLLGEYDKLRRIHCKGSTESQKISVTRKKKYKSLDEYPEINISVPENTEVTLQNSVPFIYGQPNLKVFDATPKGCGEIEVGNVTERLEVNMGGSTELIALNIGRGDIKLSGSSELVVANTGDLDIRLSGASEFEGYNVQTLNADLSGSSSFHLGNVAGAVDLQLSGASDSVLGDLSGGLDYQGSGSSDTVINQASGPIFIDVSGASDIDIKGGQADLMKISASGASDVRYKGYASNLEAKASGAAGISVYEVSGNLRESRSGAAKIKIKKYNDVTTQD